MKCRKLFEEMKKPLTKLDVNFKIIIQINFLKQIKITFRFTINGLHFIDNLSNPRLIMVSFC